MLQAFEEMEKAQSTQSAEEVDSSDSKSRALQRALASITSTSSKWA